ncbi:MAG: HEAT repeat domain-containing protein, partial [Bdellovibrionales bacterium]|nr:HEAT repeat domain-containing protein [Bdellovibrionales bacterium]
TYLWVASTSFHRLQWIQGESKAYDFSFQYHAKGNSGPLPVADAEVLLNGQLNLKVLQVTPSATLALMQFVADAAHSKSYQPYTAPMLVHFANDGKVQQVQVAYPNSELHAQIGDLVRYIQMVIPQTSDKLWKTTESHDIGEYPAQYAVEADHSITKRKLGYIRLSGLGLNEDNARAIVQASNFAITLPTTHSSWVNTIDGKEEFAITTNSFKFQVSATAKLQARSEPPMWPAEIAAVTNEEMFLAYAAALPASQPPTLRASLNLDFSKELQNALNRYPMTAGARMGWVKRLSERITEDPLAADLVAETLLKEQVRDEQQLSLLLALQMAGTPESQQALSRLITTSGFSPKGRERAVVSAGQVRNPSDALLDTLKHVATNASEEREFAKTALLNYGALIRYRLEHDPVAATSRVSELQNMLMSESSNTRTVIHALGNTRHPDIATSLAPYLENTDPSIRKAASFAFRNLDDEQSLDTLYEATKNESDIGVRREQIAAITLREPTPETVLVAQDLLAREQAAPLRVVLAQYLTKHKNTYPSIKLLFRKLFTIESNPAVQDELRRGMN